jgi:chromosome segregation ATPase
VVSAQLSQQISRARSLESEVGDRDAQIVSVNRSNVLLRASIGELETRAQTLQALLESTRAQIVESGKKLESTSSALNEAESNKAALLAKLNDPSTLRSQLKSVTAMPKSNVGNASDARLMLKPDGSVDVIRPAAKASPTEPAAKSTKVVPVFDESPVGETKSPKIILTY